MDKLKQWSYLAGMDEIDILDARGLLCPLPVLKLRKRLQSVAAGGAVDLWADDPAAVVDVPHFCAEAGHALISVREDAGHQIYRVRRGG